MKEKIKNFLLKIKNFFNEKHTFTFIQLVVIAILINFITLFLSFVEIKALDLCFNDTHTQQIEETPQTESIRIEKELKFANPTQNDYVNPSVYYNEIFFNANFNDVSILESLVYINFLGVDGYPIYLTSEYSDNISPSTNTYSLLYIQRALNSAYTYYIYYSIIERVGTTFTDSNYYYEVAKISSDGSSIINNYVDIRFSNASNSLLGQISIGSQNQLLFDFISIIPFETNSTPTLENAPSSLVNTIPSNAVTTLPNNLGTKVYDSGSAWVQDPSDFNEYDGFGYQIYYKADILTSETDMLRFTIDGVTYDVEPNIYRYYLKEVYVVIYTLWDDTPIYYISDNILDQPFPFTLNYETRFDISDLKNWFGIYVDVVNTYADYYHISISYDYYMLFNRSDQTEWLIDFEAESVDALIFTSANKESIIKDGGFQLSIIPELDPKFAKMGQSQTDNMYSTIVHGGTINQVWSNAYHRGIDVGNANGYSNGYNDGIETGKTLQNPLNPIMDFISDGALVISNVFSFEILPNISLGTMLLFPLAIALIWFVIKLFMGG